MGRFPPPAEPAAAAPAWALPYADMMTLMLACFVMLVSVSEIKEGKKFHALADSLRSRSGYDLVLGGMLSGSAGRNQLALGNVASLGRARRADSLGSGKLPVPRLETSSAASPHGGSRAAATVIAFEEGKSTLTAESAAVLAGVVEEVGRQHQPIEIRGRAPTGPVSSDSTWKNHWDLAYLRCTAAMQYLMKLGLPSQQIHVSLVDESSPSSPGADGQLSKENGSVEVFALPEASGGGEKGERIPCYGAGAPAHLMF